MTECIRCCTCCAKGGPAFHLEDKHLVEKGIIPTRFLYTIRKGEPAEDNVKGGLTYMDSDIIKIKGKDNSWACIYVDLLNHNCAIYANRPVECRVLKCWDTGDIEAMYSKDRLTRRDLVSGVEGLWELIEDHQERCSYEKVRELLEASGGKLDGNSVNTVSDMVDYDSLLRRMVADKVQTDPNLLDFLLGRPMGIALKQLGLEF
ncbi:MAG: YkgJ family cysteine cluster protein [Proteobacteria bacterium]|nr:YkgJ family cysteine cluster protein [Pseudomonadota bacterium]